MNTENSSNYLGGEYPPCNEVPFQASSTATKTKKENNWTRLYRKTKRQSSPSDLKSLVGLSYIGRKSSANTDKQSVRKGSKQLNRASRISKESSGQPRGIKRMFSLSIFKSRRTIEGDLRSLPNGRASSRKYRNEEETEVGSDLDTNYHQEEIDENKMKQREEDFKVLFTFYSEVASNKEGIEQRCKDLMKKYCKGNLAYALEQKYGKYPEEWTKEYNEFKSSLIENMLYICTRNSN